MEKAREDADFLSFFFFFAISYVVVGVIVNIMVRSPD